ncbi:hypothetical protein EOE18_08050 [Novosphingobium umbonatum]|uniref:Neutral/alkaline non-lysosomal ceramidase N-terminal domain-containing protein n=1 Tax=Novosphingobium umbonatum TaxID=1908524 RepID=A0A3S2USL6_9SPHN|nr:hypothetical protein [Novosphingobium umbonatum]RVU05905.1 hypothetical protein EOE18_08050 [Novosphingobium umbonatum]
MKQTIRVALVLAGSAMALGMAKPALAALSAGAAKVDITPAPDAFPYASPSSPHDQPFVGVHDRLFVRALVLADGSHKVALVSIENVNVPEPAAMVEAVAKAAGVAPAQVLVFATHTHSNPLVFFHGNQPSPQQAKDMAAIRSAAVSAVEQAIKAQVPARIGFARGKGWVNINNGEASTGTKTGDPLAPSDKSLDVVRVLATDGKPIALLVDYATHAEVMFRSMTRPDGLEVTGDLPGAVSALLEERGTAPVVLFAAGAEGDQLSQYKSLQADAGGLAAKDEGAAGWALLDVQARSLAVSVVDTLKLPMAMQDSAPLIAASGQAVCPAVKRKRNADGSLEEVPNGEAIIPLSLLRLGPVTLAGVGADLGTLVGQQVKTALGPQPVSVVTMTAGAVGYVLHDGAYAKPTHAVMGSPVRAGCAPQAIVKGLQALQKAR